MEFITEELNVETPGTDHPIPDMDNESEDAQALYTQFVDYVIRRQGGTLTPIEYDALNRDEKRAYRMKWGAPKRANDLRAREKRNLRNKARNKAARKARRANR